MNPKQRVLVEQRDTDDEGNVVWTEWFRGWYLTTENIGNGPEYRIKTESGEHIHIKPTADDLKIKELNNE